MDPLKQESSLLLSYLLFWFVYSICVLDKNGGWWGSTGVRFHQEEWNYQWKAAVIGFLLLLDFELLTGKGLLKGTGFLDFLYAASKAEVDVSTCHGSFRKKEVVFPSIRKGELNEKTKMLKKSVWFIGKFTRFFVLHILMFVSLIV